MGHADENLVRKPEGKRPSGRPRSRWEHNIKMILRELGQKCRLLSYGSTKEPWGVLLERAMHPLVL